MLKSISNSIEQVEDWLSFVLCFYYYYYYYYYYYQYSHDTNITEVFFSWVLQLQSAVFQLGPVIINITIIYNIIQY